MSKYATLKSRNIAFSWLFLPEFGLDKRTRLLIVKRNWRHRRNVARARGRAS